MSTKALTEEHLQEIGAKVDALKKTGLSQREALKQAKVSPYTYARFKGAPWAQKRVSDNKKWKYIVSGKYKSKSALPSVQTFQIPEPASKTGFSITGSPEEIARFIRGVNS